MSFSEQRNELVAQKSLETCLIDNSRQNVQKLYSSTNFNHLLTHLSFIENRKHHSSWYGAIVA